MHQTEGKMDQNEGTMNQKLGYQDALNQNEGKMSR